MITELCPKHRAVIDSAPDPELAFRRMFHREMVRDEKFRRAVHEDNTAAFEPLCCHVGDSAVTDAKLDRPVPLDSALDPKLIPKADKLVAAEAAKKES